jgi:hypothetical protein
VENKGKATEQSNSQTFDQKLQAEIGTTNFSLQHG